MRFSTRTTGPSQIPSSSKVDPAVFDLAGKGNWTGGPRSHHDALEKDGSGLSTALTILGLVLHEYSIGASV